MEIKLIRELHEYERGMLDGMLVLLHCIDDTVDIEIEKKVKRFLIQIRAI